MDEMAPRLVALEATCDELGRRSGQHRARCRGPWSTRSSRPAGADSVLSGPPEAIADGLRSFRDGGFTQVDLMLGPGTVEAFEATALVLEQLRAD